MLSERKLQEILFSAINISFYPLLFPFVKVIVKKRKNYDFKIMERVFPKIEKRYDYLVHLASLGEANTIANVVKLWENYYNEILVETVTESGFDKIGELFPKIDRIFFPYDYIPSFVRIFKKANVRKVILMETELWPGMLIAADLLGIKVVVINGKLSDSTRSMLQKGSFFWKNIIKTISKWYVISNDNRKFLVDYGIPENQVTVVPEIKYLTLENRQPIKKLPDRFTRWANNNDVIVFGSMHKGEEEFFNKIWQNGKFRFIYVPRHLNYIEDLLKYFEKHKLKAVLYSEPNKIDNDTQVIIVDMFGILDSIYSLCDIAIIGGSFIPVGGHNPLEALRFNKPVLFGKYVNNFKEIYSDLTDFGVAFKIEKEDELSYILNNRGMLFSGNLNKINKLLAEKIKIIKDSYREMEKL